MLIRCRTLFDITETGITGHFNLSRVPFDDLSGNKITDLNSWLKSRNQQRNFETITQILQLRTQIFDVSAPVVDNGYWSFTFTVETEGIYQLNQETFGILKQDATGVPMLIGLNDKYPVNSILTVDGSQQNIWFEVAVNN